MVTVSGRRLVIRKRNLYAVFSTDDTVVVKGNRVKVRSADHKGLLFEVTFDLRKLNQYTIDHPALERVAPAPTEIVKVKRKRAALRKGLDHFVSLTVPHPYYQTDDGRPMKKVVTFAVKDA